jgi:tRNA pseudouridine38-40 synthase
MDMTLFDPAVGRPPPPAGPVVRVRGTIAYDGSGFHGFALQPGRQKTVAGALTGALTRVLGHAVHLVCAGRTDTGVHAWGQVVTFDVAADRLDPDRLRRSVNKLLGPSIVVRSLRIAPVPDFDARRSALSRRYRYTVLNGPTADPFLASTAWWIGAPLDLAALRLACDPFIGEHDFTSFCRRRAAEPGRPVPSLVRRVLDARWEVAEVDEREGRRVLRFWIEANAFCQQMVRSIVGTMVDIGRGRRRAGDLAAVLRARERSAAGAVAPPHGLCLWEVRYSQVDATSVDD